jgi:hypothetical protein
MGSDLRTVILPLPRIVVETSVIPAGQGKPRYLGISRV